MEKDKDILGTTSSVQGIGASEANNVMPKKQDMWHFCCFSDCRSYEGTDGCSNPKIDAMIDFYTDRLEFIDVSEEEGDFDPCPLYRKWPCLKKYR